MPFIADLHIHSYYSRATSKLLNLEHLHKWAQLKGIQVVATGDFTHPQWLQELRDKLEPAEEGLFKLKNEFAKQIQRDVPKSCEGAVRFILSGEISNIYKKGDKVRKVHNVVLAHSIEVAQKIQDKLEKIGNIRSDGRPILGLDVRDLLEIVLEADEQACLIPAHIWTPWFSALGSKSGFDSIEECYGDLHKHIFAVETGLSSDPPMNWRVSSLDKYTLVSNSDAHSPQKLGRESNFFKCDMSYPEMLRAMKSGDPNLFGGTLEFYPEEGKYHLDGHRKCNTRMTPEETIANNGLCPVCGRKVTLGVSYRVAMLADRKPGKTHERALPFKSLIPLPEIVGEVKGVGENTQTVRKLVDLLLSKLGPELTILQNTNLNDIQKVGGSLLAEGIRRMRTGELNIAAGYDGEFGTVKIFTNKERTQLKSQILFFEEVATIKKPDVTTKPKVKDVQQETYSAPSIIPLETESSTEEENNPYGLNNKQLEAMYITNNNLLIVAGPGTGKTRTLTYRIAYLIQDMDAKPEEILAVTFTNKAAEEMRIRLSQMFDEDILNLLTIKTFHSLGAMILSEQRTHLKQQANFSIYNETDKKNILKQINTHLTTAEINELGDKISEAKNQLLTPEQITENASFSESYRNYQQRLKLHQAYDFDDLILEPVLLLQSNKKIADAYHKRFHWISVDEYQDINHAQYTLLRLLMAPKINLCAIGDPDQSIYGFRGSDFRYFLKFEEDFPKAKLIYLDKNYRSNQTILNASTQIIDKNPDRKEVKIWSNITSEGKLEIFQTPTEKAEAETIVHQIEKLVGATSFFSVDSGRVGNEEATDTYGFSDIAVLYRTHAQLPALEEAFIRSGIPYQTIGETPFWDQKESLEILSYLQILQNPQSDLYLFRILNIPPRGLGEQMLNTLLNYKQINELTWWQALKKSNIISSLSETQKQPLLRFTEKIETLRSQINQLPLNELIDLIIVETGMGAYYKNDEKRKYYWKQIKNQAEQINDSFSDFLEQIYLQKDTDIYDPKAETVTLMSLHGSKGLEFPVVFIAGCEDGLIPLQRKRDEKINIEEERRLLYVGMTRAKNKLILTYAASRFLFGERKSNRPSRFLADIEQALKEYRKALIKKKKTAGGKDDSQMKLF